MLIDTKLIRRKILDLAIRGKLVPQAPADEPASELLKRIHAEKAVLVKSGKIKKEKPLPPISKDEIPFDIPETWEWVRLETVSLCIQYGYTASASAVGNARMLRITDIHDNKVSWKDVPFCTVNEEDVQNYQLHNRDILIARTGGTIGKTYIVNDLSEKAVFASYLIRIVPALKLNEKYLKFFMESPLYWSELKSASAGTGQPNVNGQALRLLFLPLPPLAEQERIVTKVEALMNEVDTIERETENLNRTFALTREKVLDLAIRGKLVPQDPNDEPASELLKRIHAEKASLVKSGKLKKEKPLPPISKDEIPFDIPDNWNVLRIGDCLELVNGRAYKQSELLNSGKYRVLRVGNFFTNSSWYYSDLELPDDKYCYCGDLLYAWSASFGPRIWDGEKTIFHYHIWNVKFDECLFDKKYLYYFLLWDKERLEESKTGSTMVHVSMEHMKPRLIFIPPLAEQARIVKNLETILSTLDIQAHPKH